MTLTPSDKAQIERIFFPYADQKVKDVKSEGGRFVYYTSAETAASILKNKQIWLRSTTTMNDYSEVEHGLKCLKCALERAGNSLNSVLDSCFSGLADEVKAHFDSWLPSIRYDTFITCLSEHLSSEDRNGRLSMWRAYGSQVGLALVLNGDVMFSETDVLNVHSSPVAYMDRDEFVAEFKKIVENMKKENNFLRSLGRDTVKNCVFNMFRFAILCTKHPGFLEEREWRVIASPKMYPSKYLTQSVELVRGIPQTIQKLDLINHEDQGLTGLALHELLNRIIIGPCEFPLVASKAFLALLEEAKVPNPINKIVVSQIPLRRV